MEVITVDDMKLIQTTFTGIANAYDKMNEQERNQLRDQLAVLYLRNKKIPIWELLFKLVNLTLAKKDKSTEIKIKTMKCLRTISHNDSRLTDVDIKNATNLYTEDGTLVYNVRRGLSTFADTFKKNEYGNFHSNFYNYNIAKYIEQSTRFSNSSNNVDEDEVIGLPSAKRLRINSPEPAEVTNVPVNDSRLSATPSPSPEPVLLRNAAQQTFFASPVELRNPQTYAEINPYTTVNQFIVKSDEVMKLFLALISPSGIELAKWDDCRANLSDLTNYTTMWMNKNVSMDAAIRADFESLVDSLAKQSTLEAAEVTNSIYNEMKNQLCKLHIYLIACQLNELTAKPIIEQNQALNSVVNELKATIVRLETAKTDSEAQLRLEFNEKMEALQKQHQEEMDALRTSLTQSTSTRAAAPVIKRFI